MDEKRKDEFVSKIEEAIMKLQRTLPKQLRDKEIRYLFELIDEYATYVFENETEMCISLKDFLTQAIAEGKRPYTENDPHIDSHILRTKTIVNSSIILPNPKEGKLDDNIPFLWLKILNSSLRISNHVSQYLYSTDKRYVVAQDYLVKPHEQMKIRGNGIPESYQEL